VPFVRFARDKRGYEHVYLVQEGGGRGKASRPKVLYWYRTPPGVKVGREPFDEAMRREIEARYPAIGFDWKAITSAQPPPPDAEHWRERRRVEKAARLARQAEEQEEAAVEPVEDQRASGENVEGAAHGGTDVEVTGASLINDQGTAGAQDIGPSGQEAEAPPSSESHASADSADAASVRSRRRRRRRGRRRAGPSPIAEGSTAPSSGTAFTADAVADEAAELDEGDAGAGEAGQVDAGEADAGEADAGEVDPGEADPGEGDADAVNGLDPSLSPAADETRTDSSGEAVDPSGHGDVTSKE
jgi:hypothetical protein